MEVRSPEEIAPTIDENGRTRGLWFDWEMVPYCGGRYRVKDRVERIIDERTGQMIEIASDCLILDGVVCSGQSAAPGAGSVHGRSTPIGEKHGSAEWRMPILRPPAGRLPKAPSHWRPDPVVFREP